MQKSGLHKSPLMRHLLAKPKLSCLKTATPLLPVFTVNSRLSAAALISTKGKTLRGI